MTSGKLAALSAAALLATSAVSAAPETRVPQSGESISISDSNVAVVHVVPASLSYSPAGKPDSGRVSGSFKASTADLKAALGDHTKTIVAFAFNANASCRFDKEIQLHREGAYPDGKTHVSFVVMETRDDQEVDIGISPEAFKAMRGGCIATFIKARPVNG